MTAVSAWKTMQRLASTLRLVRSAPLLPNGKCMQSAIVSAEEAKADEGHFRQCGAAPDGAMEG